jgi:hypothetical protein
MKSFKVMEWLRRVRDEHQAHEAGLAVGEEVQRTREKARLFRASRTTRKGSDKE